MATFNAGAIEATLTLDRSPWNRELRAAQAQARRMAAMKIAPKLNIDGTEKLAALAATLEGLDDKNIELGIDVDGKEDLAMAAVLINNLDGKDIDLNIDVNGYGELVAAQAMVAAMDGSDIDIDIDSSGHIGRAVSGFSRMQALVTAILVLLPLVPPVAATVGAALVGITAGLVGAAGPLGVLGLGIAPTLKGMFDLNAEIADQKLRLDALTPGTKAYEEQQKKINNLQKQLNERFGEASSGLDYMREKWDAFTKATEPVAQGLIGQGMRFIGDAITAITPIFNAAAPVVSRMFDRMSAFLASDEGGRMITFFEEFGVDALESFIDIGGNLIQFLGRLFEAFAPFGGDLLDTIADLTQGWADWADTLRSSPEFQEFLDYVAEEGPKVWDLIKNIGGAIINLGVALAPLGSGALDVFNKFFGFIADMDPTILGAIATGLGIATVAVLAITGAIAALNFVLALNPFVLLAVAVIALVGAIIYLWNTNEGFRDAIIGAWNAIVGVVQTAVGWFQTNVLPVLQTIWNGIVAGFQAVANVVGPIISLLVQIVQQGFNNLMAVVGPVMNFIVGAISLGFRMAQAVVSTVLPVIIAIVRGGFNAVRAVVSAVMNVIVAIFRAVWGVVRAIFTTALNVIQAVLRTVLAAMRGDVSGVMNGIRGIFSAVWNGIRSIVSAVIRGIGGVVSAGMNGIRNVVRTILNAVVNVFRTAWNTVRSVVRGGISAIRGMFAGAGGWLIGAGRSIIQGLISGIRAMAGAVRSAVSGVLSAARNLLPFSPAKEGPFSGKGWTLYSGRSMIEAMAQGIGNRKQMLVNQVQEVMSAVQSNMAPGASEFGTARRPSYAIAGANRGDINVRITANNPLPERSSTTAVREVTRLGQLGVFSG